MKNVKIIADFLNHEDATNIYENDDINRSLNCRYHEYICDFIDKITIFHVLYILLSISKIQFTFFLFFKQFQQNFTMTRWSFGNFGSMFTPAS